MDVTKIATKIRTLRAEKQWTQRDLAEKLNVSGQLISKWETGESVPSLEFLDDLRKVFGVPMSYFTDDDEQVTGAASDTETPTAPSVSASKPSRKPIINNKKVFWISLGSACAAVLILAVTLLSYYVFAPAANKKKYIAAIDTACSAYFDKNDYYNIKFTNEIDGEKDSTYFYQGYFDENGDLVSYNSEKNTWIVNGERQDAYGSVGNFTMPEGVTTLEDWAEYDMADGEEDDPDDPYGLKTMKYIRKRVGGYYFELDDEYLLKDMSSSAKKNIKVKKINGYAKIKNKVISEISVTAKFRNKKEEEDYTVVVTCEFVNEFPQIEIGVEPSDPAFAPIVSNEQFVSLLSGGKAVKATQMYSEIRFNRGLRDGGKYLYYITTNGSVRLFDAKTCAFVSEIILADHSVADIQVIGDYIYWAYLAGDYIYATSIANPKQTTKVYGNYGMVSGSIKFNGVYAYFNTYESGSVVKTGYVYDLQARKVKSVINTEIVAVDTSGYAYAKVSGKTNIVGFDAAGNQTELMGNELKKVDGDSVYIKRGSNIYRYGEGKLKETLTDTVYDYQSVGDGLYFRTYGSELVDGSGKTVKEFHEIPTPQGNGKFEDYTVSLKSAANGKLLAEATVPYYLGIMDYDGNVSAWTAYSNQIDCVIEVGTHTFIFLNDEVWMI